MGDHINPAIHLNGAEPVHINGAAHVDVPLSGTDAPRTGTRRNQARGLLQLYHDVAEGSDGVMMLVPIVQGAGRFNKKTGKRGDKPFPQRIKIGNVDGMTTEALDRGDVPGTNVYFAVSVVRKDIEAGARGRLEDITGQLGIVVDHDPDKGEFAVKPPIDISAIVQTCAVPTVNEQWHIVFNRVLPPSEAEELATLLHRKCGGDSGTKDIDHVWRVPGTFNYPNDAKLARGRPADPQRVRLVGGTMTPVDPDDLRRALKSMPDHPSAKKAKAKKQRSNKVAADASQVSDIDVAALLKKCGDKLTAEIKAEGTDRSKHSFVVMCQMFEKGLTDVEVAAVALDPASLFAGKFVARGDLDEEIDRVRAAWKAQQEAVATETLDDLGRLNESFAVVRIGGKTRVMGFEESPAMKGVLVPFYQSFADFKAFESKYRIEVVNDRGETKKVKRGEWWLEHPDRRQFKGVVFAPNATDRELRGRFNLWTGFACEPVEGDCSLLLKHITDNVCSGNDEYATYMLDWMAWGVQNPGERAGVAIVTRGGEGAGKGIVFKAYGRLFGAHFVHATRSEHVVGKFNSHLQQCSVLFADEAFFAGDRSNDGTLKGLITEETIRVEPKGIDSFEVSNALKVCMASNNDWVIPAGADARRYFVLDVSDAEKQNLPYFKAIAEQMDNGGREALLYFLLNRDLSDFDIRAVPKTEALAEQKAYSRRGLDLLVETLISDGELPVSVTGSPHIAITSGERNGEGFYPAARKLVPDLKHMSSIVMKRRLRKEWGCEHWHVGSGNGIAFPRLLEMRERFDRKHGPQEWSVEITEWR